MKTILINAEIGSVTRMYTSNWAAAMARKGVFLVPLARMVSHVAHAAEMCTLWCSEYANE